ncbi:hypothetical protein OHC33_011214 [Knufia fluminis]|uniref:Uncharacterized protein n=1 Tax=Knufia fluminis TaxID=191047 RepID=A0AAN8EC38_9EURO|nr:hypothetical protein OHC33_011214 [Knufia fluminis]
MIDPAAEVKPSFSIFPICNKLTDPRQNITFATAEFISESEKAEIFRDQLAIDSDNAGEDVQSRLTHRFLQESATPLGLYDWSLLGDFKDKVQPVVEVIEDVVEKVKDIMPDEPIEDYPYL